MSAWHLLELTKDITRARTHFLILTLRRTASSNPRTLFSLVDAEVLPWSVLEAAYANRANALDLSPASPKAMLAMDEEGRKRDGALGSVMVVSVELPKGDNRPPRDALTEVRENVRQIRLPRSNPSTCRYAFTLSNLWGFSKYTGTLSPVW